jgi:hypothetical protein
MPSTSRLARLQATGRAWGKLGEWAPGVPAWRVAMLALVLIGLLLY